MLQQLSGDTAELTASAARRDTDPVSFLITMRIASLRGLSQITDSLNPVTLILENCKRVRFRLPPPWDGSISPKAALRDTGARPRSQITEVNASRFSLATFLGVGGARITIGYHEDSVRTIHTFEVHGSTRSALSYDRRAGFRYDGVSGSVMLNGDDLVSQNLKNIPELILATIIGAALAGIASLGVILLRIKRR